MKKQRNTNASLDLFLDTICNVFGGVIFIALLIVILVQQTVGTIKLPEGASPEEIANLWQELDQISSDIAISRVEIEALRDGMPKPRDPAELERVNLFYELSAAMGAAAEKEANLLNLRLAKEREMLDWEDRIKTASTTLQQKQMERQEINQEITQMQNQQRTIDDLKQQIAKQEGNAQRTETIYMPRLRPSDPNSRAVEFNLRTGSFTGQVLGNRKIQIEDTERTKQEIRRLLRTGNRNIEYLRINVYDDSADQWHVIRDLIVDARFQYQLLPTRTPPPPRPPQPKPTTAQRPAMSSGGGSGFGGGSGSGSGSGTGSGTSTAKPTCSCGKAWCPICNPPGGGGGAPLVQ